MKKIFTILILIFMLAGCKHDGLFPDFIYEMTLSSEALNLEARGGTSEITIKSNYKWTAQSSETWCKVSKASGEQGSYTFTLEVEENPVIEERVAYVTVTAGSVVRKIKVVQLNPDGFEIIDYEAAKTVGGLENILYVRVKTNAVLTATSDKDWIVGLTNNTVAGNPPKETIVRVLFKDNATSANRTGILKISGVGLPASYEKTITITQTPAPEIVTEDSRVIGTWLMTRVSKGVITDLSLLGTIMKFNADGTYTETLTSGAVNQGTWNVRDDRVAIYYNGGSRRYIYIAASGETISGTMTETDINSDALYALEIQAYSGAPFGITITEKSNTSVTYMILINSDMGLGNITEKGICISKTANPSVSNSKKYVSTSEGSVIIGRVTTLASAETYHIRAYLSNGSKQEYSEDIVITTPVEDIDGNGYNVVKIGDQTWFSQNLAVTKYKDGTPVGYYDKNNNAGWEALGTSGQGGYRWIFGEEPDWLWADDTFNHGVTDRRARSYGAFYNWFAVSDKKGLCPEGWHAPSKNEFITLLQSIGTSTDDFAGGDMAFKNGLLDFDQYTNNFGWNGWAVSGCGTNGSWKGIGSENGNREITWWSGELDPSETYPWLLYHRRGNSGDGGIS